MDNHSIHLASIFHTATKLELTLFSGHGKVDYQTATQFHSQFQSLPAAKQLLSILARHPRNFYLHYRNTFQLDYLVVGLFTANQMTGFCLAGPFISKRLTAETVGQTLLTNHLTVSERQQLTQFYQSLPVLSATEFAAMGELMVRFFNGTTTNVQTAHYPEETGSPEPIEIDRIQPDDQTRIEARYQLESHLMQAVASGDLNQTVQYADAISKLVDVFETRIPNQPLRSGKNICFVCNTLCRTAAKSGGVHPVFLDHISEKYAILVEKQTTIAGLKHLVNQMICEYTQLVANMTTSDHSPIIKRAADFIAINLGHPLSLQQIAHHLKLHPVYLSRRFKAETGLTITDYINQHRLKIAENYLKTSTLSITEIAVLTGFSDGNYFTRVFKKTTGQTPSQFRKSRYPTSHQI